MAPKTASAITAVRNRRLFIVGRGGLRLGGCEGSDGGAEFAAQFLELLGGITLQPVGLQGEVADYGGGQLVDDGAAEFGEPDKIGAAVLLAAVAGDPLALLNAVEGFGDRGARDASVIG